MCAEEDPDSMDEDDLIGGVSGKGGVERRAWRGRRRDGFSTETGNDLVSCHWFLAIWRSYQIHRSRRDRIGLALGWRGVLGTAEMAYKQGCGFVPVLTGVSGVPAWMECSMTSRSMGQGNEPLAIAD